MQGNGWAGWDHLTHGDTGGRRWCHSPGRASDSMPHSEEAPVEKLEALYCETTDEAKSGKTFTTQVPALPRLELLTRLFPSSPNPTRAQHSC